MTGADPVKARNLANKAVREGVLTRLPCVVCGNPKSHGHHEDYSKPLEVVWLCSMHHRWRHAYGYTVASMVKQWKASAAHRAELARRAAA